MLPLDKFGDYTYDSFGNIYHKLQLVYNSGVGNPSSRRLVDMIGVDGTTAYCNAISNQCYRMLKTIVSGFQTGFQTSYLIGLNKSILVLFPLVNNKKSLAISSA